MKQLENRVGRLEAKEFGDDDVWFVHVPPGEEANERFKAMEADYWGRGIPIGAFSCELFKDFETWCCFPLDKASDAQLEAMIVVLCARLRAQGYGGPELGDSEMVNAPT